MIEVIEIRSLLIHLSRVFDGGKAFFSPEELKAFCDPMWIRDVPVDAWCGMCSYTSAVINPMGDSVCLSCGGRVEL